MSNQSNSQYDEQILLEIIRCMEIIDKLTASSQREREDRYHSENVSKKTSLTGLDAQSIMNHLE